MFFLAFAENIQLLPDGTLFIHILMILAMIWILNRTFFRPINRVIRLRDKNKGGQSVEAKEILKEAAEKNSEYFDSLREARSRGYDLIEEERIEAMSWKQEKIYAAKQEVAKTLKKKNARLEKETADAKEEIVEKAERVSEKISVNILNAA
jgi:F0F1-type ATP synthase membrane subunit b/b'